jgi:hypothetical protein
MNQLWRPQAFPVPLQTPPALSPNTASFRNGYGKWPRKQYFREKVYALENRPFTEDELFIKSRLNAFYTSPIRTRRTKKRRGCTAGVTVTWTLPDRPLSRFARTTRLRLRGNRHSRFED